MLCLLDYMQIEPRRVYTKQPVKSLSDCRGLKIRAIGPADGAHVAMKFYEVTKYIFNTENTGPSFFILANRKAMEALPADVRKALMDEVPKLTALNRASYATTDGKAREVLLEKGMEVNLVPAAEQAEMRRVAQPIVAKWADELKPDARKVYDIAKAMINQHQASR
jgi:TRAP-type C4-dicarboxylate transport system substrate-binding protein